jgi:hypothetical protein
MIIAARTCDNRIDMLQRHKNPSITIAVLKIVNSGYFQTLYPNESAKTASIQNIEVSDVNNFFSLCFVNRHSPTRSDVHWDGANFIGTCRHCNRYIRREKHKLWKLDEQRP